MFLFFFQAEDGIRDGHVTGVQTCALPILNAARDVELHRGGDRAEGHAGAGDERFEEHVAGAGERARAPGRGMEPGLDERAAGLDPARDLLLVELPVGPERDERRCGLLAIAVLERLLHRLQLGPVHGSILQVAAHSPPGWGRNARRSGGSVGYCPTTFRRWSKPK